MDLDLHISYSSGKSLLFALCQAFSTISAARTLNLELVLIVIQYLCRSWGGGGGGGADDDVRKQLGLIKVCNSSEKCLPFTLRQASLVAVSLFCKRG